LLITISQDFPRDHLVTVFTYVSFFL
jgi:hypothetical protein